MMTPLHPVLSKPGPLTEAEMISCVNYEGLFGIGLVADIELAERLHNEGKLVLTALHGTPHVMMNRNNRKDQT